MALRLQRGHQRVKSRDCWPERLPSGLPLYNRGNMFRARSEAWRCACWNGARAGYEILWRVYNSCKARQDLHLPSPRLRSGTLPAPAITLGLALVGAVMLHPWATSPARTRNQSAALQPSRNFAYASASSLPRVWLVESGKQSDLYSNGLRVENQFAASRPPRRNYLAYARRTSRRVGRTMALPAGRHCVPHHREPSGAFRRGPESHLSREGEGLLEYVSRQRSYHFVIDRFGRVFRIVQEAGYANHAGNSIWADDDWIYLNLNQSFFGVAFEAQSSPDGRELPVNRGTNPRRTNFGGNAARALCHSSRQLRRARASLREPQQRPRRISHRLGRPSAFQRSRPQRQLPASASERGAFRFPGGYRFDPSRRSAVTKAVDTAAKASSGKRRRKTCRWRSTGERYSNDTGRRSPAFGT